MDMVTAAIHLVALVTVDIHSEVVSAWAVALEVALAEVSQEVVSADWY